MHSRGRLLENEGGHSLEMFVLENKLRPLIFRNFLSKIFRKPKMGYAPHPLHLRSAPSPRGEGFIKGRK